MKKILLILSVPMLLVGIAFDTGMSQTPPPTISVSPAEQDFGEVMMGQSSYPQPFTITNATNTGGADLVVSSIELTGGDSRMFSVDPGTCASLMPTIPAGGSCYITLAFSPSSGGGKSTALKIVSNAINSPAVGVPLTGTGLQPLNVGLALLPVEKTTYNFGEAINIALTLQNAGGDIYTSKGFKGKAFELFLVFTDPDEKIITSNLLRDTDLQDPPPPRVFVLPSGELVPNLEPVEKVEAGWVLSINIPNALNYYRLSKGGSYSVKAMIPMRTYPGIDYTDDKAVPPVDYSFIDRYNSQGALESNIVNFTLLAPAVLPLHHIDIKPLSSTIIPGGNQSYTATGYDQTNNSLGDVTAATTFSIANGTCALNVCTANVAGNQTVTGNYSDKTATATLVVYTTTAANQTIDFRALPNKTYGDRSFELNARASSGLPVGFSILSGPATISGKIVTITGVGTVTARASQAGNSNYFPAPSVDRSFQVSYLYTGFLGSIHDPPTVNNVKAGETIRVKWRISDKKGVGISDRASFVSLTSYKTSCTDWTGTEDPVTESAGASGLQYLGNGNWQFDWKTSKTYAGTCRIMALNLKGGSQYKAEFKFKSALNRLVLSPASATIAVGGSQAYTATGYDGDNNSLGDVTSATTFSIRPNGSCTGNACTATAVGPHTVTGNDGGKKDEASLKVIYNFTGFLSPVDNPPTVNVADAGQTVLVKWRITDANDMGISDRASFAGLTSRRANCGDWNDDPTDTIEGYISGAPGLHNLENGNWQFDWKTRRTYAGTCRIITIKLHDGTEHKARFKFNK